MFNEWGDTGAVGGFPARTIVLTVTKTAKMCITVVFFSHKAMFFKSWRCAKFELSTNKNIVGCKIKLHRKNSIS